MNIIYLPLLVYLVSSVLLVILYHKSSIKDKVILPQISQTGMKLLNKDTSFYMYFISFLILGLCSVVFYMKCIHVTGRNRLIIVIGVVASILNVVQALYTLDTSKQFHEMTAYGGIFLHLVALSIYLYVSKHDKKVTYMIVGAWLSILLMGPAMNINFNLGSLLQRLCVCLLIVTATMIAKENKCFK